mmetsp:Transcript_38934/g.94153  ORF Transcript_38934/g.94153 Transcript_38934/m.94153 type:complete len:231 (+) Transcript_38934:211-903(+)
MTSISATIPLEASFFPIIFGISETILLCTNPGMTLVCIFSSLSLLISPMTFSNREIQPGIQMEVALLRKYSPFLQHWCYISIASINKPETCPGRLSSTTQKFFQPLPMQCHDAFCFRVVITKDSSTNLEGFRIHSNGFFQHAQHIVGSCDIVVGHRSYGMHLTIHIAIYRQHFLKENHCFVQITKSRQSDCLVTQNRCNQLRIRFFRLLFYFQCFRKHHIGLLRFALGVQ